MASPQSERHLIQLVRQAGIYISIPLVLVGGPTVGFFLGRFLDQRLNSDPWGVLILVVVGLVAAFVETIRLFRYAQKESDAD